MRYQMLPFSSYSYSPYDFAVHRISAEKFNVSNTTCQYHSAAYFLQPRHPNVNMVLLEVEQKFSWTQANLMLVHLGTSPRPFKKLHELNLETLRDNYYDKGNQLSSTGLWVRKRQQVAFPHMNPLPEGELTPGAVSWQAK